ncbi:hypothetical protein HJG60_010471 [Phyllostomus discolor]|uniref:Uncharacterized protein n=1 Tax=Phyllostomus discolor TaxID=89673 RepID=A0A834AHD3_9CHIR|nr:hypothetical protein HJG60_010471 [Phyllostomus discolor]
MFKVVLEVPKPLPMVLNSCFFILFWLNVSFFLLVQTVDLSPGFLPVTIGSLYIFLYFTFHSLHFFLYVATTLHHFCEHPDCQCFELCIDGLAISSSLILSQRACYIVRGGALGVHCGTVCAGGVQEGTMLFAQLSASFQSLRPLPTSKLGPSGADFQVGGLVYSKSLWVSPTNSPMRLGISPATSTPTGFFSQKV